MHVDQFRKMETYSPKSSPRGGRSPIVSRQDSSGTLKTTISLGKNPSIVHSGPFYLMKEPPGKWLFHTPSYRFDQHLHSSSYTDPLQTRQNDSKSRTFVMQTGYALSSMHFTRVTTISHSNAHFLHLFSNSNAGESELTGATNLMAYYGLEHSYSKFSGKKVKEQLSSFLPNLPGVIDGPGQIVRILTEWHIHFSWFNFICDISLRSTI